MPQRRKRPLVSPFAQGYTPQMREAVDRMPIPNEIKCCVCKRRRPKSLYSNNQLGYLRQAMFDLGYSSIRDQQVAKCGPCTNAQACEELCHRCGHYRAIDQFARNQRNRENPLCQPCMNYQMSLDPVDQPLAITDKVVVEDTGDDEEEELDSESAGRSEPVALSGSMERPESVNLSGSCYYRRAWSRASRELLFWMMIPRVARIMGTGAGLQESRRTVLTRSLFPPLSLPQAGHPALARSMMALLGKEEGSSNCFQRRANAFPTNNPRAMTDDASTCEHFGC